ncbi:MAG: T9SS type A sorting domain-containing protein [Bacteroidia bacterium]
MRKYFYILIFVFAFKNVFAQKHNEVKLPVTTNYQLQQFAEKIGNHPSPSTSGNSFFKTNIGDSSFPFIDRFMVQSARPDPLLWPYSQVAIRNQSAVFDAMDTSHNVYSGSFGAADPLYSIPVFFPANSSIYVEFSYSTGATWSLGDSLVLQVQNSSNWQTIWTSANLSVRRSVYQMDIDPNALNLSTISGVVFRFINYTNLTSSNTEDFLLHYFVFTLKWNAPGYENFSSTTSDSFPSKFYWEQGKTQVANGATLGVGVNKVAVFDAFDENNNLYNGGAGGGFADTLTSNFIDLTRYAISDSVFLCFSLMAMPNAKPSDSILVEFKSNIGNWFRQVIYPGNTNGKFILFNKQVNYGKMRTSYFQFRIINKCNYTSNDTLKWIVSGFSINKKIKIPFIEDFSTSSIYPDQTKWLNKAVFINNNFPLHPPSFNVATFDGLDSRGNAYGFLRTYCDTLTSQSIDLSAYQRTDSVYLSFFIEPMGLGQSPRASDSFIVEMRNSSSDPNSFVNVWTGLAPQYSPTKFTQIIFLVDSAFLHNDFQFRFKNIGSQTGNLNHWNLDYIRLDKGRSQNDLFYDDLAISSTPFTLLNNYTSMPWKHFVLDSGSVLADTSYFFVKNNSISYTSFTYSYSIYNQQPSQVYNFPSGYPRLDAGKDTSIILHFKPTLTPFFTPSADTVSFTCKYAVQRGTTNDNIPSNDVYYTQTNFSNYFAYDDGSAEAGYAIANYPGMVALKYTIDTPDTLFGISVFFNQSFQNVSNRPFEFRVWKDVALPPVATGQTELYREGVTGPQYMNTINGFYYFKFQNPVPVSGHFYIGWFQYQVFDLNVGLDQNFMLKGQYAVNPNMYFKTFDDSIWYQTQLTGALMMRPIVGKWLNQPQGVDEVKKETDEISVYPNPANDVIYISSGLQKKYSAELMDMTGREIISDVNCSVLRLPSVSSGIYILKLTDENKNQVVKKMIINQN